MSYLRSIGDKGKRGSIMQETVIHIILIALILAVFVFASAGRVNGRDVKQQVLEKQLALLIDSAEAGMSFEISKGNLNGLVDSVEVQRGRVYVGVDGFPSSEGYAYFSKYSVGVEVMEDKFVVHIKK